MAYIVNKTNGDILVTIDDGTADVQTTSLVLIGKNYSNYGEPLNENLIKLLENSARSTRPTTPMVGQQWYDTVNQVMMVYTGDGRDSGWDPVGAHIYQNFGTGISYVPFLGATIQNPALETNTARGPVVQASTGNFGIGSGGTIAPQSKLVVSAGTDYTRSLSGPIGGTETITHLHGSNSAIARFLIDSYGTGGTVVSLRQAGGTAGALTATQANTAVGSLHGHGHNGTDYSTYRAGINFVATENWTTNNNGTRIEFYTTPVGNATPTLGMRLLGSGTLEVKGDVTAYYTSDPKLKTDIQTIDHALDRVKQISGVTFNWNELAVDKDTQRREAGVLADQVKAVMPEVVIDRDDGYQAVQYEKLVPLLIEAIKELAAEVETLKNR